MVKFTTTESKPRWGSTWRLVVTTSSPYQASPRAYLWLSVSWHPDPEVGVRDEELMGLQPTQGSLQEFKLLQEVLLLEGAGVHWQEVERTTSFVCMESLCGRGDHPEEKYSWCHYRQPLVSWILTILILWQTDMRLVAHGLVLMLHLSLKSLIFISCFNICYGFIHLICALTDAVAALQLYCAWSEVRVLRFLLVSLRSANSPTLSQACQTCTLLKIA